MRCNAPADAGTGPAVPGKGSVPACTPEQRLAGNPDTLGTVRIVSAGTMFGQDKREHLNDPYPGLFQNPGLLDPEFDMDHSQPLIRYRILVDGKQDAQGEFHYDHDLAISKATTMINRGRYGRLGKFLSEVKVYDADGDLLGRDRQVRTRVNGQKTVQWESIAGSAAKAERTEAKVRAMGTAFPAR